MKRYFASFFLFFLSLAIYLATLAPTVVTIFDDSLELQVALPTFAIVHPTGYPLYTLLGWLTTRLVPIGDAAYRANLFSALAASLTVALVYPVARRLGGGAMPAIVAALLLAISPIWWSQATIAEVYTFQGVLTLVVLYALLRWDEARGAARDRRLILVGFAIGLGLTHHRLSLLLLPAAAVFVIWGDPGLLRRPRAWLAPGLALLLPLLLYAILPLRGQAGSLDGGYARIGFWGWVLGGGYSAFFAANPFDAAQGGPLGIDRSFADLIGVVLAQFGLLGAVVALLGWPTWQMQPRRFVLLALILLVDLLFASRYLVADIEVFLLPAILSLCLFLAVGLTVLWDAGSIYLTALSRRVFPSASPRRFVAILSLALLIWPALLAWQRLPDQDRSQPAGLAWGVHEYGLDMLDTLPPDARLVGLLGEMTLVRYFQRTQDLRPDLQTLAADPEPDRLAALAAGVASGQPTYTTRPLSGLAEAFSLSAEGPLIRVLPPGQAQIEPAARPAAAPMTPEIELVGWDISLRQPASGPAARLTLDWQTVVPPADDLKVSARLLAPDGALLSQVDAFPVHNSYPTSRWRAGETVRDSYDLALSALPVGPLTVQVILYQAQDGAEVARWEQSGVLLGS